MSTPAPSEPVSQNADSDTPGQSRIVADAPDIRQKLNELLYEYCPELTDREHIKTCTALVALISQIVSSVIGEDEREAHLTIEQSSRLMMGVSINEPVRIRTALRTCQRATAKRLLGKGES